MPTLKSQHDFIKRAKSVKMYATIMMWDFIEYRLTTDLIHDISNFE